MKIQFLGTGAAEGFPAAFCNCKYCNAVRKEGEREFRTRSQVLIDGCLSVDFPPEAFAHSLKYNFRLSDIRYLLVTHSHMDHFYAHDFILRGYKYAELSEPVLEIFGNAEVQNVFNECTAREMKPVVAPNIIFSVISPHQIFNAGEYRVTTISANHSKTEDAMLFYIENKGKGYLHFYDTGRVADSEIDFLAKNNAKVDLVCFDCTFVEHTAGYVSRHMGIEDAMAMKEKLIEKNIIDGNTKILVSHFSHNANPTREKLKNIEKEYGVTAAYDGLTVEI